MLTLRLPIRVCPACNLFNDRIEISCQKYGLKLSLTTGCSMILSWIEARQGDDRGTAQRLMHSCTIHIKQKNPNWAGKVDRKWILWQLEVVRQRTAIKKIQFKYSTFWIASPPLGSGMYTMSSRRCLIRMRLFVHRVSIHSVSLVQSSKVTSGFNAPTFNLGNATGTKVLLTCPQKPPV